MEIQEALAILRKLADGVHPETAEILQKDCLYHHPQAVRAGARLQHLSLSKSGSASKSFCPATPASPGRTRKTLKSATSCGVG